MGSDSLLVIQAGGPTPVMNASLCGVLRGANETGNGKVFGARRGLEGLIHDRVVDLGALTSPQLERLRLSPGAALGSSRLKPSESDLEQSIRNLRKLDIHQVLMIGGNGTMHAAEMFRRYCASVKHEVRIIGIPKTIDNDINGTDRCPGYASAARYVAQSTRDLGMDLRSLPQPVSILETMGRNVGWLAAASAAGKRTEQDAPHLVYVPEIPFEMDKFVSDLDRVLGRQDWAIVVVSEGIRDKAGRPIYEAAEASQADALKRPLMTGVARVLAETAARELKVRCRDEKPGLVGRASMLHVSTQDLRDAELVGRAAYRAVSTNHDEEMVALTPLDGEEGAGFEMVPFDSVIGSDRGIPAKWLCDGDIPLNQLFEKYVRPLIGDLLEYDSVVRDLAPYAHP
jgi:ATP-dependent phosphofructokinase / diphosphate-dependent phosphofructokinase